MDIASWPDRPKQSWLESAMFSVLEGDAALEHSNAAVMRDERIGQGISIERILNFLICCFLFSVFWQKERPKSDWMLIRVYNVDRDRMEGDAVMCNAHDGWAKHLFPVTHFGVHMMI